MVESHNMKLLQTYCKYFWILHKASALESKQFHQNLLCAVLVASKGSPREEPPLRELMLKQKSKAKCAVFCYFIFVYLLYA